MGDTAGKGMARGSFVWSVGDRGSIVGSVGDRGDSVVAESNGGVPTPEETNGRGMGSDRGLHGSVELKRGRNLSSFEITEVFARWLS